MLKFASSPVIRFPQRFPGPLNEDRIFRFQNSFLLAPFWGYINNLGFLASSNASVVYYHVYDQYAKADKEVLNRANADVQRYQTNPSIPLFKARWMLVVTWVRLYPIRYPLTTSVSLSFTLYSHGSAESDKQYQSTNVSPLKGITITPSFCIEAPPPPLPSR